MKGYMADIQTLQKKRIQENNELGGARTLEGQSIGVHKSYPSEVDKCQEILRFRG
jgi:hypothetical protein